MKSPRPRLTLSTPVPAAAVAVLARSSLRRPWATAAGRACLLSEELHASLLGCWSSRPPGPFARLHGPPASRTSQVGVAVAIIVITALHLADYNIVNDVLVSTCVLADTGDDSICNYAYAGERQATMLPCNHACFRAPVCGCNGRMPVGGRVGVAIQSRSGT
eukprot:364003-Chlamydomonas_euryale.AAC.16